jgi:hypothetical protein
MKLDVGHLSHELAFALAFDVGGEVGNHRFGVRVSRQSAKKSMRK